MPFIDLAAQAYLKFSVLLIHYTTRTPLIGLYYIGAGFGVFGPKGSFSWFCFYTCLFVLLTNIMLVVLFNWEITKNWCISTIGEDYYNEYMSHSAPALKSLMRVLGGTASMTGAEFITAEQWDRYQNIRTSALRQDIEDHVKSNKMRMARQSQQVLNEIVKNYNPGGVVTQTLDNAKTIAGYESTSTAVSDTAKSALSWLPGKKKRLNFNFLFL